MIPCEIDLTSNLFRDTTILVCEIELHPAENKTGFDLLDDKEFTIPFVNDTILNSPAGHQLLAQARKNVWIVAINYNSTSHLKVNLMNSSAIRINVGIPRSVSVY